MVPATKSVKDAIHLLAFAEICFEYNNVINSNRKILSNEESSIGSV